VSVCLAGVVWGTIGPAVHVVHERSGLSVLAIGAHRAVAAVVCLGVAVLATGRLSECLALCRRDWRRLTVVGASTAAFQLLFFVAVVATGVSVATVVALGIPPVLLLLMTTTRERRLAVGRAVAVMVAVVGLLLVCLGGGGQSMPDPGLGVLTAVGSGAAFALSAHAARPLSRRYDALTVTTMTMSVAATLLAPGGLAAAALSGQVVTTTDAVSWWLVVYLGAVTMGVAYVLLFAGLRTTPSDAAVLATLLEPVTAVTIAVLFLGEELSAAGALGSLLILAAIACYRPGQSGSGETGRLRSSSTKTLTFSE
jgi:DME family drug/metabolite transporter